MITETTLSRGPSADAPPAPPLPIVALDVPTADAAYALLRRLGDAASFVKVGLQLFIAAGPEFVRSMRAQQRRVFLDLKLHDIPNTVAGAVAAAAALDVELLTLHVAGGARMLEAARAAADDAPAEARPRLLGVTMLTSLSAAEIAEVRGTEAAAVDDDVERLAGIAARAALDGIVAAVPEAARVRRSFPRLRILTPGIRLAGDASHDQARVATPAAAAAAGANYVVLGRAVTAAADPAAALARAVAELNAATAEAVLR